MMDFFLSLSANVTYYLSLAAVFLAVAIIWFALGKKVQEFADNYKQTFTSTATANASDMFMTVDPNQLFTMNIIAIIVLPVLTFVVTRDTAATVAMLGLILFFPNCYL